jgi:hypothetical protein
MINATAIGQDLINLIADEWIAQGHNMTGAFVASMTADSVNENDSLTINIYDNTQRGYGVILDNGVRPEQIKYTYAKARIAGLVLFVQARMGLSAEDALPVAFAIAHKHKKEGMPTQASSRFSQTGNRTRFVNDATQQEAIDAIIQNYVNDAVIL